MSWNCPITTMTDISLPPANPASPDSPRLLDQLRDRIRFRHYSRRTELVYIQWVRRYIRFHGKRHPRELGAMHITAFLSSLATDRRVAASTQNQALAALLFLYKEVLGIELPWMGEIARAKLPRRLPVVLTHAEAHALLGRMEGTHALMAKLMYGTGMRLMECLQLRLKGVELDGHVVVLRQGQGAKDRITVLPLARLDGSSPHLDLAR